MQNDASGYQSPASRGLSKKTDSEAGSRHTSLFEQFQLQPSRPSPLMEGNVIHITPDDLPMEQVEASPAGVGSFGRSTSPPSANTTFPGYVPRSAEKVVDVSRPSESAGYGGQSSAQVGKGQKMVALQNVDPDTAKNILGQLVQVLQQAGQLPQDEAFQRLVQLSSGGNNSSGNSPSRSGSNGNRFDSARAVVSEKSRKRFPTWRSKYTAQAQPKSRKIGRSQAASVERRSGRAVGGTGPRSACRAPTGNAIRSSCSSEFTPPVKVKSEIFDNEYEESSTTRNYEKYDIHPCEVRLERLAIKQSSSGKIVIPESPADVGFNLRKLLRISYTKPRPKPKTNRAGSGMFSGDPSTFPDSIKVSLLPCMNEARDHVVRTMYMGPTEDIMQWLTVVWWRNSHFFCQCVFCPLLAESPKTIVKHLREDHPELLFALNKKDLLGKSFLFVNCRHCDFVAVDPVVLWIHLELHHGVSGILDGGLHPDVDLSVKAELSEVASVEVIVASTSYVCFDCFRVSTESKSLALHVLQEHVDTLNYNGCFVKLMMIQKPSDRSNVTYNQAISDPQLACSRWDIFICMLCDLCVKCPYTVLSHTLSCHQNRHLLLVCSECPFNTIRDDRMIEHLSDSHGLTTKLICSSSVVGKTGNRFLEVPIRHNRKTRLSTTLPSSGKTTSESDDEFTTQGSARRKRKTAKNKTLAVNQNGVQTAKTSKASRKTLQPRQTKEARLQSKVISSSRKVETDGAAAGQSSTETGHVAASAEVENWNKVKEEVLSSDTQDGSTSCVAEDLDYKITLADEANCESDDQEIPGENHSVPTP